MLLETEFVHLPLGKPAERSVEAPIEEFAVVESALAGTSRADLDDDFDKSGSIVRDRPDDDPIAALD
ncbi:MAG TPA: hypothetical protein VE890_18355, partial [Thermoguttaceae bacterium]|nr:hypothetical protein [Thermoguttaceae bacterium]